MTEKADEKVESLPDLDDLLQCPVCYEIPSGQIFQCNEGHHVCGRCKMRLDVCPVCRAFFFGTRNYAMEELIANVRKLRAFKLGGKVTTGSPPAEVTAEVRDSSSEENESTNENINFDDDASSRTSVRPPTACKGLFRCLCCKNNPERLPLARLLNHLRYYHSPDLIEVRPINFGEDLMRDFGDIRRNSLMKYWFRMIEGRSESGGYLQAWQFPTSPGRMVTAVRVHDMGIFFLIIEITPGSVHAWMSMAASPWVAHEFSYSFTLSGNDREAIFSDCVWSVRSCEGSLKRRGRCLVVSGADAHALLSPAGMSGKLSIRRTPQELQPAVTQPRAVLRVANRSHAPDALAHDLEPFLQDLQNDVARISRAFASLGREADALVRSEAEMRGRLEGAPAARRPALDAAAPPVAAPRPDPPQPPLPPPENGDRHLSRNARRRMRQRLREAFRLNQTPETPEPPSVPNRIAADHERSNDAPAVARSGLIQNVGRPQNNSVSGNAARVSNSGQSSNDVARANNSLDPGVPLRASNSHNTVASARATNASTARLSEGRVPQPAPSEAPAPGTAPLPVAFGGPSQDRPTNGNTRNKKKRRRR